MPSETNNTYKIVSTIVSLFEEKFALNCPYYWPFAEDFARFALSKASENLTLEQLFFKSKEQSLLYEFKPTDDILKILKESSA